MLYAIAMGQIITSIDLEKTTHMVYDVSDSEESYILRNM